MATVIKRKRTWVDKKGSIRAIDVPVSYKETENKFKIKLDRRKNYAIIKGKLCELCEWSEHCSGCTEVPENTEPPERGMGCHECGYTGRSRRAEWVPFLPKSVNLD